MLPVIRSLMVPARKFHDTFALVLHAATVVVMIADRAVFDAHPTPAAALAVMQGGALVFHAFYLYLHAYHDFGDYQNQHKWIEYALTATAGTVAALTVTDTHSQTTVVGLAIAACAQQAVGWQYDNVTPTDDLEQDTESAFPWVTAVPFVATRSGRTIVLFGFAFAVQIVEFTYVATAGGPTILVINYVFGWGLFGLHAALRQRELYRHFSDRYKSAVWVETIYSCLGWSSKILVFGTEWAYLSGNSELAVNLVGSFLLVVAIGALVLTARTRRTEIQL
jgi:hypothetical protein